MKRALFALILAISLSVFAAPIPRANLDDCGVKSDKASFLPAERALRELKMPAEMMSAAVVISVAGQRCSGSYVSDSGEILLASHCLDGCAERTCDAVINGQKTRVQIEVRSHCKATEGLVVERDREQGKTVDSAKEKCADSGDIAVVRADTAPKNFSCLSIHNGEPRLGQAVFTMSTPGSTYRTHDKFNADGSSLYVTTGAVLRSNRCINRGSVNPIAKFFGQKAKPSVDSLGRDAEFLSQRMIQVTADTSTGSSGGPLINSEGEIIGVAALNSSNQPHLIECVGAAYFEKISRLAPTAKAWNPSYDPSKLRCTQRRAIKNTVSVSL